MNADQASRFWEATITLMVTLNFVLIAVLHYLQTERWKRRDEQHEELAQHVQQCTKEHQSGPTSV